ncbi:MAG: 2-octaprenyl-6-methoxyphenyl hydroxylase [Candidatus Polarisedimenticolaceae bacterium]|nr:2-octaprenyl-6-methoxyphenyl hydroxylase [Candidatus Polarisedimenticolaceae bacterium]
MIDYDILIIGGGMVGASLARAMSGLGLKTGIIEAHPYNSDAQSSYDDRAIALAWGSRLILEGMGCWDRLQPNVEPILGVHISDRGHCGFTRLNHKQEGVDALGYVATGHALGKALLHGVGDLADIELICPARLNHFVIKADHAEVHVDCAGEMRRLKTKLLVGADGVESIVRKKAGIELLEKPYDQTAIIANITPGKPHDNIAYERFTDSGPLAMLPMTEGRCSLVWTAWDRDVDAIMGLADKAFLAHLQQRFGFRLGRLQQTGGRATYPLKLRQAKEQFRPRLVLIGNAAHAVHPVTGQGYNLGIRDVSALAEVLADAASEGADPGQLAVLKKYAAWRQQDHDRVLQITDTLARIFANPLKSVTVARDLGLIGLNALPMLRHSVARQFMGMNGKQPRLSRGLPLIK